MTYVKVMGLFWNSNEAYPKYNSIETWIEQIELIFSDFLNFHLELFCSCRYNRVFDDLYVYCYACQIHEILCVCLQLYKV